ncbi:hypothetical protein QUF80_21345 [Desulfococcaceae bacterium HSG8]|nr:hypothetical protein [Desulfococcaceae bacterium HSG8]
MKENCKLAKTICFFIFCSAMLISGCAGPPKELILPESKLEMERANAIISEGERMINEGEDMIDDGDDMIDDGEKLVKRGKKIRNQGEEKVDQGENIKKLIEVKETEERKRRGME